MTLDEVAERLGKSKRTILRWVDEGRFPSPTIRRGKLIIWTNGVVQRWSQRRRQGEKDAHNSRPSRQRVDKD